MKHQLNLLAQRSSKGWGRTVMARMPRGKLFQSGLKKEGSTGLT